jgi:tetratricopeptide (TPR) repeat protein
MVLIVAVVFTALFREQLANPVVKAEAEAAVAAEAARVAAEEAERQKTIGALLKKARWQIEQHQFNDAAASVSKVLTLDPDNVDAYVLRGNLLQTTSRFDSAMKAYQAALQRQTEHPSARRNAAFCEGMLIGDWDQENQLTALYTELVEQGRQAEASFVAEKLPKAADWVLGADNEATVYVNGKQIGSKNDSPAEPLFGKSRLKPGDVITAVCTDHNSGKFSAGFLFGARLESQAWLRTSDFRCTTATPPDGWKTSKSLENFEYASRMNIYTNWHNLRFAGYTSRWVWSENQAKTVYFKAVVPPLPRPVKASVRFDASKSMKLYQAGYRSSRFPVMHQANALQAFIGQPVYFNQRTGQDVVYNITVKRPITAIYYKGAAWKNMVMSVTNADGDVVASYGPKNGGNVWLETTLDVPPETGRTFTLTFHNEVSTWFYIDEIELRFE